MLLVRSVDIKLNFYLSATARMMSPIKRDANGTPSGQPIQVATKRLSTGYADLFPRF